MISTQANGAFDSLGMYSGTYFLRRLVGLRAGAYLASARQGERDILKDGVSISNGTATVEIVVRPDGGRISGKITDNDGRIALNATAYWYRNRNYEEPVDLTINFPPALWTNWVYLRFRGYSWRLSNVCMARNRTGCLVGSGIPRQT